MVDENDIPDAKETSAKSGESPERQVNKESGENPKGPSQGWIENLAQRSTGLPQPPPNLPPEQKSDSVLWRYAGLGFQFAATTALMAAVGYGLDRKYGWAPWGLVGFSAAGMIGGFYLLIKEALRNANQDDKETTKTKNRS